MRKIDERTCMDMSALRSSDGLGGGGYGRGLYGLQYGTAGLLRDALGKAWSVKWGHVQRGRADVVD
jgi:hypothetical protein